MMPHQFPISGISVYPVLKINKHLLAFFFKRAFSKFQQTVGQTVYMFSKKQQKVPKQSRGDNILVSNPWKKFPRPATNQIQMLVS